jgi:hypothetical protein
LCNRCYHAAGATSEIVGEAIRYRQFKAELRHENLDQALPAIADRRQGWRAA